MYTCRHTDGRTTNLLISSSVHYVHLGLDNKYSVYVCMVCTECRCAYLVGNVQEYVTVCLELIGKCILHFINCLHFN